ncbi:MAG: coenzyme A pyrophosphatase, partial [Pseudolabrys sp.]|nr:coenzyme A pyrophosphatase [Pseudolabrys sp.]
MQPAAAQMLSADDFFARVRERLTLDVPAGLTDPNVIPRRGDH